MVQYPIRDYKVNSLPAKGQPNARYYVLNSDDTVDEYITDKQGNFRKVGSPSVLNVSAGTTSINLSSVVFSNDNNVSFGLTGSTITASIPSPGAEYFFSNSNGASFGTNGSIVTISYSVPTQSVQTQGTFNTSQLNDYQLTANNSLSLDTSYTSHTHSQYLNTSVSSLFLTSQSVQTQGTFNSTQLADYQLTANNSLSLGTEYTSHTHSQYFNTSQSSVLLLTNQSSLFQQTSQMSDYLGTNYTTHTHSQYLTTQTEFILSNSNGISFGTNNSTVTASYTVPIDYVSSGQSSLFQQTSQMSDYLGTNYSTHTHSEYLNTSQSSLFRHTSADSQLQFTSQMSDYVLTNHTHSQYINTSQSSLFQHTSATSLITSNALNTSQSSLFRHTSANSQLQFTSQMSDYLDTNYTTHTHPSQNGISSVVLSNTTYSSGQISFRDGNGISFASTTGQGISIIHALQFTSNTSDITSNAFNTSGSSNFLLTANSSLLQHTSATSAITSNALNTSQSSLFAHTSAMTSKAGTGVTTAGGAGLSATLDNNGLSVSIPSWLTTARASNDGVGLNTAQSNVTWTINSSGISLDGRGYAGTGTSATNASITLNSNGLAISVANPGGGNINLSAGTTSNNLTNFILSNSNNISFGLNGSTVTATASFAQSQQPIYFSLSNSNTSANTMTFGDLNGVSWSFSNGSIVASVQTNYLTTAMASNRGSDFVQANAAFAGTNATGTIASDGISVSVLSQSNQTIGGYAVSNTTQSTSGTIDARSLSFHGAGIASVGISNGSVIISVPAGGAGDGYNILAAGTQTANTTGTVVFSNSNGVSFGMSNNSVITASIYQNVPREFYNPYGDLPRVAGQVGQGTLNINPNDFPNCTFDRVYMPINITNSSNSSGSHTLSFWLGIYTRTVSTLSLLTSQSTSYALTHSGTAGSYSLYSGMRHISMGISTSLGEGLYYIGIVSRTTSGGTNGSYSQFLASNLNSNFLGHFSSSHNTTYQFRPGVGIYSVTTSGIPSSIGISQIRGSDSLAQRPPVIIFANSTI